MSEIKNIENHIIKELAVICKDPKRKFASDTALVGPSRSLKSVELVELLLKMEDYVEENFNSKFDWSDNSAMSETRSVLRTVNSLAEHILELSEKK
tara:strand:+ start:1246 stop:1533 length:288 start_codon:yes stop_codon:yes gene_type:complete